MIYLNVPAVNFEMALSFSRDIMIGNTSFGPVSFIWIFIVCLPASLQIDRFHLHCIKHLLQTISFSIMFTRCELPPKSRDPRCYMDYRAGFTLGYTNIFLRFATYSRELFYRFSLSYAEVTAIDLLLGYNIQCYNVYTLHWMM